MTDVRSMLRTERNARRINHPHASYAPSGLLSCSLCKLPVKSEAFWDSHLRSAAHSTRLRELQNANRSKDPLSGETLSKKRKIEEEEGHEVASAKKVRNSDALVERPHELSDRIDSKVIEEGSNAQKPPTQNHYDNVDEDEWAAFEHDMAAAEVDQQYTAISNPATISAKPVSAQELAAQKMKEEGLQKEARETEQEEEREEASRQVEEEMDRMSELDEKMKAWRHRQEALRKIKQSALGTDLRSKSSSELANLDESSIPSKDQRSTDGNEEDDEDEDGDGDDEWDPWLGLGGV